MPKLASFGRKQDRSGNGQEAVTYAGCLLREHGYFTIFFAIVQRHISLFITCLPFHLLYNDSSGCLESHEGMVERRPRQSQREAGTQPTFEWWLEAGQFWTLRAARKRTKVMPTLLPCNAAVQQSRCRKYDGIDTVLQKLKRLYNRYLL
ncbi:hypothetical protein CAPTEDRAFT_189485 [Capitella teleta]|uniref:Uncharacterized protein n=1 Tax=Capitella teleta TaxID=283909 RepID=R7V9C6_CAPTE|nr:hypothetical protein CAPTEDRAFT_189485 [Capitella teleta]|eukprot:ELU12340.1 hypothetical protein CAPTEDRAFT_189485 [Capitella teleta]